MPPAARSSAITPQPRGSRSSAAIGHGFTISKKRKRPKARIADAMGDATATAGGMQASVAHTPATSSMTTCPGSAMPVQRPATLADQTPSTLAVAIPASRPGVTNAVGAQMIHGMATRTAAAVPHVPGAGRKKPTPPTVESIRGMSGTRDQGDAVRSGRMTDATSGIDVKFTKATVDQLDQRRDRLFGVCSIGGNRQVRTAFSGEHQQFEH